MVYLRNATYIDYKTFEFKSCDIRVGAGKSIEFLTPTSNLPSNDNTVVDCTGKYVTRSFANAHHHVYSSLATGMPAPKKRVTNFYEVLQNIWWVLDNCLDEKSIEASAWAVATACIKNGCTFVIDHHSSPNKIKGSLNIIKDVFDKAGLSHLLCYEITDRNGWKKTNDALEETDQYLSVNPGLVGLHASFTVCNETMEKAIELTTKYNTGIHIHVAEDEIDQRHSQREYNMRVVRRLYKDGALKSPKTLLVHCLHIDDYEKDVFKNTPAWIVQNTESNLNNNVGSFNSEWLNENILLGTDGMHSNMMQSAKVSFITGIGNDGATMSRSYNRLRKVHKYLQTNNFDGDADNNLVVFDYKPATDFNQSNFLSHFFFAMDSSQISDVISNGKLIYNDRKILTFDENATRKFTQEQSVLLWEKMKKMY